MTAVYLKQIYRISYIPIITLFAFYCDFSFRWSNFEALFRPINLKTEILFKKKLTFKICKGLIDQYI